MKAIYIEQPGGIDAMRYGDFPTPRPGPGEVLVKIAYSGVNFIDTYHRSGLYNLPLPAVIGSEASGAVEKLGEGVTGFKPGDRVAYTLARGMMVAFGQSSGPAAPIDVLVLSQKGSLYVTRPTLFTYIASREDLEWRSSDLFRWIGEGKIKINIDTIYPLADAGQAHADLEGRKTTGKLLLKI
jgi:NADPH:quinone reductase-like Zn-dependent oxidoreductase